VYVLCVSENMKSTESPNPRFNVQKPRGFGGQIKASSLGFRDPEAPGLDALYYRPYIAVRGYG
jgi:hypothetical protein